MSKSKQRKNEAHPADGREPTADSCSSDAPIYQSPSGSEPLAESRQPTADSRSSDSRQPTANSRFADCRQPIADSCSSDEINLLDYLRVIYKYKWMIMIMTILAMAGTVAYSLSQPRMYQANTSIVPPIDRLSQGGGLASKLGGAGSMLLKGMLNEGDLSGLYVGILKSRKVSEALIDGFDLVNVYAKKRELTRTDARRILKRNTTIKASKEGIVHITVKDLDANRSAAIANAYRTELDIQITQLSGGQAASKVVFLEARLKEIQDELTEIDSLHTRDVQVKEMLFELLSNECEMAKIEKAKSMPTIQVLDEAIAPEEGMGRGTAKKGILTGFATMMLGMFVAFGREYVANEVCKESSSV